LILSAVLLEPTAVLSPNSGSASLGSGQAGVGSSASGNSQGASFSNSLNQAINQTSQSSGGQNSANSSGMVQVPTNTKIARQNLPLSGNQDTSQASAVPVGANSMQLLMAQLAAQNLLAQSNSGAQVQASNTNNSNGVSQSASMAQLQDVNLMMQGASSQAQLGASQSSLMQSLDSSQASMIANGLAKALGASGKNLSPAAQNQAATLLASLQQASVQGQSTIGPGQSLVQIANSVQNFAQNNAINLPVDLQQRLAAIANQGNTGSIKLLGLQAGVTTTTSNVIDWAKSKSTQAIPQSTLVSALGVTSNKTSKAASAQEANKSIGLANRDAVSKTQAQDEGNLTQVKGDLLNSNGVELQSDSTDSIADTKAAKTSAQASDAGALSAMANGLGQASLQSTTSSQNPSVKASELSLVSGPLHTELMNVAKSGGGRVTLELTPPEQGTIRIDLQISQTGQAHLIVDGASDATKARLDQGGQNLKNEFAQMGLNLSLDLRQGAQSQQAQDQAFLASRQANLVNSSAIVSSSSSAIAPAAFRSGNNSANSSAINLYA
jgi:hypothetical protein